MTQPAVTAFAWLQISLQQSAGAAATPASYVGDLLRTLLALCVVTLLAWVTLRALSLRGFGHGFGRGLSRPGASAELSAEVLHRTPLDGRRSLLVVRVAGRVLLLGLGETGAPQLIAELEPGSSGDPPTGAGTGTATETESETATETETETESETESESESESEIGAASRGSGSGPRVRTGR